MVSGTVKMVLDLAIPAADVEDLYVFVFAHLSDYNCA